MPGVKGVLVTGGGAGCSYAFHGAGGKTDYTGIVPVLKVESTDTTGAGDAFLGGFIASLVKVSPKQLPDTMQCSFMQCLPVHHCDISQCHFILQFQRVALLCCSWEDWRHCRRMLTSCDEL